MTTVGVVIPVYRCENYVRGCIESVLAQTRPVDQIVLVDDCGGDRSIDIAVETLREHGREHRVITQPRNGGLGRARNTGLAVLTTDLVWFLDSDDTAAPSTPANFFGAGQRRTHVPNCSNGRAWAPGPGPRTRRTRTSRPASAWRCRWIGWR